MKNLFDTATAAEVQERIRNLSPLHQRQWGKMTVPQAVEHCAIALEWAVSDRVPSPGPLPTRILGRLIKPLALGNDEPMRRNSPTAKTLMITHEPDFERTKERLTGLLDRFTTGGPQACTTSPHPFFGKLTPNEWAILMYKHLDHHLRQFSA